MSSELSSATSSPKRTQNVKSEDAVDVDDASSSAIGQRTEAGNRPIEEILEKSFPPFDTSGLIDAVDAEKERDRIYQESE